MTFFIIFKGLPLNHIKSVFWNYRVRLLSRYGFHFSFFFFSGYGVSVVLSPELDYTSNVTHKNIIALNQIAKENSRYEDTTINWLEDYYKWFGCNDIPFCIENGNLTGNKFYANLSQFLSETRQYIADVRFDSSGKITASRVIFFYENDIDGQNQAKAMKTIRTDLEEKTPLHNEIDIFAIAVQFIYAEQYAKILGDTIQNLLISAAAILVITITYLIHPGITILVFLSFCSLVSELLGLMTAWDTSLDAIAMLVIIMAIGFSVDYTCHVAHAYMISKKPTPERRVADALSTMGTSVLNGGR